MSSDSDESLRSSPPPPIAFPATIPPPATAYPRVEVAAPSAAPSGAASSGAVVPPVAPQVASRAVSKRDADTRATFEVEFAREILGAERFRALLLVTIATVTLFALVIVRAAYPDVVVAILHGQFDLAPVGFFLMAVVAFQLVVLSSNRRARLRDERPSASTRYGQAFVETSLPTAAVLYYAASVGPARALLMPSTFAYFVFILLSTLRLDFVLSAFTGLVAAGEYAFIAIVWGAGDARVDASLSSLPHHLSKASILLVSGVAAGFVAQRLRRSFSRAIQSVGDRQRILGVFGQHVSPEVVERLVLGKTEVKSEIRDVCVMFLDIRNFTSFSEGKSPGEVVDYLNTIFESTIDAVSEHHGIVNKFLGDGFMAIFGAPIAEGESCTHAVSAALDIVARIEALVAEGKLPPTRVGIGLHAGEAVVGNIGSAQRKEYTVIGDVVNVASRIEALNKQFNSSVLASEEVWNRSGRSDIGALFRESIPIRGRAQPIRIWQLA